MDSLTRGEAIIALKEGKRLSHSFFDDDEWIETGGQGIICEDGASIDLYTFFYVDRGSKAFDNGWSIISTLPVE